MLSDTLSAVLFELGDEGVATLTINRPKQLNALNTAVIDDLAQCVAYIAATDAVRGVIVTGAGPKSFVAGADIKQFTTLDAATGRAFAQRGQAVFSQLEQLSKPVIAAVNGFALGGGCELAMACHLRVASENARFGQPEVNLGVVPGYGGTQRLPRLVGRGRALEMILTGEMVTAQRAYEMGLVNRVVPAEELMPAAQALMQTILGKAPIAVALSLNAVYAADQPQQQGMDHEAVLFGQACDTSDFREGVAAFLERRPAHFEGR